MSDDQVLGGGSLAIIGVPPTGTYGTPVSPTHAIWLSDAAAGTQGAIMKDLSTLATGKEYPRNHAMIAYDSPIRLRGEVDEYTVGILAALAIGGDTVSLLGSGCYQHLIAKNAMDTQLKSTSIEIYNGLYPSLIGGYNFDGLVIDNLTLRWTDGGSWEYEADCFTNGLANQLSGATTPTYTPSSPVWPGGGTQVVVSTSVPSAIVGDPGGTLATVANMGGGSGSGWTNRDWSGAINRGAIRIRNNLKKMYAGNNFGLVSKIRRGKQQIFIDLTVVFDPSTSTIYDQMNNIGGTNPTDYGMIVRKVNNVNIGGSYSYGLELIAPQVQQVARPQMSTATDREREFTTTYQVLDKIAALAPVNFFFWNTQNIDYA